MCPPFYSKNGTANKFSRTAAWLLKAHFEVVWADKDPAAVWKRWWEESESNGLCYSFECCCPRFLGDHGATPKAAYMVLTAVSSTREAGGRFLSPGELLNLAKVWRLPVNEMWLFHDIAVATHVEEKLHSMRWTADDSIATKILDSSITESKGTKGTFLTHGETQGEVLEGFVLFALRGDTRGLAKLAEAYSREMEPFHDACLAAMLAAGKRCFLQDTELEKIMMNPLSFAPEPVLSGHSEEKLWTYACAAPGGLAPCLSNFSVLSIRI